VRFRKRAKPQTKSGRPHKTPRCPAMKLRYTSIVELQKRSKQQAVRRVSFHPNAQLAYVALDDEIVGSWSRSFHTSLFMNYVSFSVYVISIA
jgi:hypothetical protein